MIKISKTLIKITDTEYLNPQFIANIRVHPIKGTGEEGYNVIITMTHGRTVDLEFPTLDRAEDFINRMVSE
jgi:hypothetical protein